MSIVTIGAIGARGNAGVQPLAAGAIAATAGDGSYTLTELAAPSGGTGSYTVTLYESTTAGVLGSLIATNPTYPYQRSGRSNGTAYYVTRRVSDGVSTVDSEQVSVTPEAPSAVEPFFEDGFDQGQLTNANGFVWAADSTPNTGDIAVVPHPDGGAGGCLRMRYETGDSGEDQYFNFGRNLSEFWMQYMLRVPNSFGTNSVVPYNNKLFACYANSYSTVGHIQIVFEYNNYPDDRALRVLAMSGPGANNGGTKYTHILSSSMAGQWLRIRIHLKAGDGTGEVHLWRDNTLVYELTNYEMWFDGGSNFWRNGYLMGSANGAFSETTDFYIDDFKVWDENPGWSFG